MQENVDSVKYDPKTEDVRHYPTKRKFQVYILF